MDITNTKHHTDYQSFRSSPSSNHQPNMARSLDRTLRDVTGNVIPLIFLFALTAYITTVLIYSNGNRAPVPSRVSAGFLSVLGSLILFWALGRIYRYFKRQPPPDSDEERPASSENKTQPVMVNMPHMEEGEREDVPRPRDHQSSNPAGNQPVLPQNRDGSLFSTLDIPSTLPRNRPFRPFRPSDVQVRPMVTSQRRSSPRSDSTPSPLTPSRIPRPLRTGPARLHQNSHSRQASADFAIIDRASAPPARDDMWASSGMRGSFFEGTGPGSLPRSAPNLEHGTSINVVEVSADAGLWVKGPFSLSVPGCPLESYCVHLVEGFDASFTPCKRAAIELDDDEMSIYSRSDTESEMPSTIARESVSTDKSSEERTNSPL